MQNRPGTRTSASTIRQCAQRVHCEAGSSSFPGIRLTADVVDVLVTQCVPRAPQLARIKLWVLLFKRCGLVLMCLNRASCIQEANQQSNLAYHCLVSGVSR